MSLQDLLSSAQGAPVGTQVKPVTKTGGLSGLLSTAIPNTNEKATTSSSVVENPQGSGFPALKPDGTQFTPVTPPQRTIKSDISSYIKENPQTTERVSSYSDFLNKTKAEATKVGTESGDRIKQAIATFKDPKSNKVQKAVAVADGVMSIANTALSGATATLSTAEQIPYAGKIAHVVNGIFGFVGKAGSDIGGHQVDQSSLSSETKATIKPIVQEIFSLAAQIATGKIGEVGAKRTFELTKTVADHIQKDPTISGTEKKGLATLLEEAQKPEVTKPTGDITQVVKDAKIKTVTEGLKDLPKGNPKQELAKSLGKENEFINGNSYAERQKLLKDVIEPQVDALGKLKDDEVLVYHNTPDGELKSDNYVSTNPEQMWMYADKNTIVRKVKRDELLSTGVPEKDAFGERLYKEAKSEVETMRRELKPAESSGEKMTSKLASGVEEKAIEKKLTETFGDLPEYNKVNMKEQADLATKLLNEDPERARRIAMGEELPPSNILPESIFTAIENLALKLGDVETIRDLATKSTLSTEATAMGQRIRALAERNPDTPVAKIAEVQKSRAKAFEKKGKTIKKAKAEEVEKIKKEIKKKAPTKQEWSDFIKEIQCNY